MSVTALVLAVVGLRMAYLTSNTLEEISTRLMVMSYQADIAFGEITRLSNEIHEIVTSDDTPNEWWEGFWLPNILGDLEPFAETTADPPQTGGTIPN